MASGLGTTRPGVLTADAWRRASAAWLPGVALIVAACAFRFATLGSQSLWFDEAYTPVHDLAPSLGITLSAVAHNENTPPLWYVVVWCFYRLFGEGAVALRLASALAGTAMVWVGWEIGRHAGSRRTSLALAAIFAVDPLFMWYSQEARAYELYALTSALSVLWFLDAYRSPSKGRLALWALAASAALATEYFAVFLAAAQAAVLLAKSLGVEVAGRRAARAGWRMAGRRDPREVLVAVGAVAVVIGALVPLALTQGGRGTGWIRAWPLSHRVVAILSYYVLGYNGAVLGHAVLAACSLPLVAALAVIARSPRRGGLPWGFWPLAATGALAVAGPLLLVALGVDYLAPRNLIGAWVPLSAALAVATTGRRAGVLGALAITAVCCVGAGSVVVTALDTRLQRADWKGVAAVLAAGRRDRAIATIETAAAPLEYYLPAERLGFLSRRRTVRVSEIDVVGYAPLPADVTRPPAAGFRLTAARDVRGIRVFRFSAPQPHALSGAELRRLIVPRSDAGSGEVLVSESLGGIR